MPHETDTPSYLDNLHHADWETAFKTFGNNHATLIGLLVQWWIRLSPETHTVMESGPATGYKEKGKRGQCDALFCANNSAVGVLEVEGMRPIETARKIGYFFDGKYTEIQTIAFGILLVYPCVPTGRGVNRHFPPAITGSVVNIIREVSLGHQQQQIVLLGLDKRFERCRTDIRSRNPYYQGVPSGISGQLWQNGIKESETTYLPTGTSGRSLSASRIANVRDGNA